ncbi:M23 family metallopeptidase [Nocardioides sp. LHG3406-4]|uniref:M23 family metallopeptidase n=1 Tax=Nocardioides sp. LHG3406-4 TaxID=2804575 RepID=UPI003CEDC01E
MPESRSTTHAATREGARSKPRKAAPVAGARVASRAAAKSAAKAVPQPAAPAPGRRKAAKHTARSTPLFRRLPSAPVLVGVAALAISAGGAISAADPDHVTDRMDTGTVAAAQMFTGATDAGLLSRDAAPVSRTARRGPVSAPDAELVAEAEAQARQRNTALEAYAEKAAQQALKLEKNQWVLPVDGYRITATFGMSSGLWAHNHTGLDFAAPSGTPIRAVAGGVVTSTGYDGAYGNKTVITLEDGTEIWYCHQTSYLVSTGDSVAPGEVIGSIGSTGHVTGPHLHLEVRPSPDTPVDPYAQLVEHGVQP